MTEALGVLQASLLELLHETEGSGIQFIIGGGYGIYLRMRSVLETGRRTLLDVWPEGRSTNDIDLFLRPKLLIDSKKLSPLSEAFEHLGYKVVPGAEKFQFVKTSDQANRAMSVKIDILTGPQDQFVTGSARVDARRVGPIHPWASMHILSMKPPPWKKGCCPSIWPRLEEQTEEDSFGCTSHTHTHFS